MSVAQQPSPGTKATRLTQTSGLAVQALLSFRTFAAVEARSPRIADPCSELYPPQNTERKDARDLDATHICCHARAAGLAPMTAPAHSSSAQEAPLRVVEINPCTADAGSRSQHGGLAPISCAAIAGPHLVLGARVRGVLQQQRDALLVAPLRRPVQRRVALLRAACRVISYPRPCAPPFHSHDTILSTPYSAMPPFSATAKFMALPHRHRAGAEWHDAGIGAARMPARPPAWSRTSTLPPNSSRSSRAISSRPLPAAILSAVNPSCRDQAE